MLLTRLVLLIVSFLVVLPTWSAPRIVVSIKPIHSLVMGVMEGVGEPFLLLDGNSSPHHASLKPSQARALQKADLFFWIGAELENFLVKPVGSLLPDGISQELMKLNGLQFPPQENGNEKDAHIWLDTQNAITIVHGIAKLLKKADPSNSAHYLANSVKFSKEILALEIELKKTFEPMRGTPFFTAHDAYGHFENRFGLSKAVTFETGTHSKPGAKEIARVKRVIKEQNIKCFLNDAEFNTSEIGPGIHSPSSSIVRLDPLGLQIDKGRGQYVMLMQMLARDLSGCLQPK